MSICQNAPLMPYAFDPFMPVRTFQHYSLNAFHIDPRRRRSRVWRATFGAWLLGWLVAFGGLPSSGSEPVLNYGTGDWLVAGLGNVRVRLAVSEKTPVVWAHVAWRRRDAKPEDKAVILVDAATGRQVTNMVCVSVLRSTGDLLFEPPTAPGEYFLYYLPFQTLGPWYFPTTRYLAPTNTADPEWAASCAPIARRIRAGEPAGVPAAKIVDIQAINDFHRFDPMEITATPQEMARFLAEYRHRPYLLFPEDRRFPIRMTDELPVRWVEAGPRDSFQGDACRGEFYTFQVGLYANRETIRDVQATYSDLTGADGTRIPASALRCFNLGGTNWLGQPFRKTVNVPKGKVQTFWFGVALPKDIKAQAYHGTVTFAAQDEPPSSVALELEVSDRVLADAGDSQIWRQSRLRWLDSTIGLDDKVFAPYTPVQVENQTVRVLGRSVHFNSTGLLDSIESTFSRNNDSIHGHAQQLLAGPMAFIAETGSGAARWAGGVPRILKQSSGAVVWESRNKAGPLRFDCWAKMECDGYINFKLTLRTAQPIELKDVRLEIPLRREEAVYMMGLGRKGGYRPDRWHWKWNVAYANNELWLGDVNAGLSCKLKDIQDRWDLYNLRQSGPYRDWSNNGRGGCDVDAKGGRVVIRAYTGPRRLKAGALLHFNFGLLITPVKVLDKRHWHWRYFHRSQSLPVAEVAKTGATIINIHQGDTLNPYINYPFLTVPQLSAYTRQAHARGMKVKLYYTVRELSNHTGEFWALRSLGDEVFADGPGFHVADQFQERKPGAPLPKTGDSWLCEHVIDHYVPAWHTPLGNGRIDAALATTGLSRWHNYYLEGLNWLIRNVGIDGLYLDGIGYDREIMKRVRKVMQRSGRDCLIDFHSGNNFHPEYGLNSCANQYMELFPCIDSLWFGEGFDYNEPPDYWLVEISGIPYGLFGEMLQGGGNPWRGMLFGMTSRLGWGGDPRLLWKLWDQFGIQEAKMVGFWDPDCPVKTGRKDVLATAYVRPGQTLISLASWATNTVDVRLHVAWARIGLNPALAHFYAPPVAGFQAEALFQPAEAIPVTPARGWLLLAGEAPHNTAPPR